jgi:hypothetical protein
MGTNEVDFISKLAEVVQERLITETFKDQRTIWQQNGMLQIGFQLLSPITAQLFTESHKKHPPKWLPTWALTASMSPEWCHPTTRC